VKHYSQLSSLKHLIRVTTAYYCLVMGLSRKFLTCWSGHFFCCLGSGWVGSRHYWDWDISPKILHFSNFSLRVKENLIGPGHKILKSKTGWLLIYSGLKGCLGKVRLGPTSTTALTGSALLIFLQTFLAWHWIHNLGSQLSLFTTWLSLLRAFKVTLCRWQ